MPYLCLREIITPFVLVKIRLFREVDGSLYLRYRGGPLRRLIKGKRAV